MLYFNRIGSWLGNFKINKPNNLRKSVEFSHSQLSNHDKTKLHKDLLHQSVDASVGYSRLWRMPRLNNDSRNSSLKRLREEFQSKFENSLKEANEKKIKPLSNLHKISKENNTNRGQRYEFLKNQISYRAKEMKERINNYKHQFLSVQKPDGFNKRENENIHNAIELENSLDDMDDLRDLSIQLPQEHLKEVM